MGSIIDTGEPGLGECGGGERQPLSSNSSDWI